MWMLMVSTALAGPRCGLGAHLPAPLPQPPAHAPARAGTGKLVRDLYAVPNALESENFVVRWGNTGVDADDAAALSAALEAAWDAEVDRLGYREPLTARWTKLNVYIGDSGDGAPSASGSAGYYWYDDEAYPMLVLSTLTVADQEYARAVAAHEFFHGVQAAYGTYAFGEVDFWYWEATATWITSAVFPANTRYPELLFGQAFQPEQSINGYFYGDEGVLAYHPYGAFIFVTWLTEIAAGPALVRRSWAEAPQGGDPILQIEGLLDEAGWTLADGFSDFARRNATWDYADGALYADSIEASGGWSASTSTRPVGVLDGETDGWLTPSGPLPHTLGASYWQVAALPDGAQIRIEADAGPRWTAWLAGRDGDAHASLPVATDGSLTDLSAAQGWTDPWLVIAAVDGTTDTGEVGSYRLEITGQPQAPDTDDSGTPATPEKTGEAGGCGSRAVLLFVLLGIGMARHPGAVSGETGECNNR